MNALKVYTNPEYLSVHDLDGKEYTVEIESTAVEMVKGAQGDPGRNRVCCKLKGREKKLVLNKGNVTVVAKAFGQETNGWIGKKLVIYQVTGTSFGERNVPLLKVRPAPPEPVKSAAPAPQPAPAPAAK